jgi:hypothetical protein
MKDDGVLVSVCVYFNGFMAASWWKYLKIAIRSVYGLTMHKKKIFTGENV